MKLVEKILDEYFLRKLILRIEIILLCYRYLDYKTLVRDKTLYVYAKFRIENDKQYKEIYSLPKAESFTALVNWQEFETRLKEYIQEYIKNEKNQF